MVKRCVWLVLLLSLSFGARALSVTTTLDSDQVSTGESVVVTFKVDEQVDDPDFSPLEKDFEIVDRRQSQNITIVNGQPSFEMAWTLVLMPKGPGELTVPRIQFGNQYSQPRRVTVTGSGVEPDGDVQINYSVDDATPYVSQQVLLTTQVYTVAGLEDLEISAPRVVEGEARLDKLGRARTYHSMRGGRRYTVHEQRYTLLPQASGRLVLSPIDVRGRMGDKPVSRASEPLVMEVLPPDAAQPEDPSDVGPRDLFLEIDVDKRTPYVQEQVLYTVRVYRAVSVENASLSAVTVSGGDVVVERIGRDRIYRDTRDNKRFEVTERRFVLFPQTSGALMVEPVRLQASVPLSGTGGSAGGFWSRPLTKPVRIESEPVRLNVRPPPPDAPRPWLPARDMTLEEEWPERGTVEVGTPITRRVVLRAEGLLASQLPDLDIPLPDAVKSYPEQPVRENSNSDDTAVGELQQTVALIPSRAGTFTLPAMEVAWWNTRTDEPETVRLPPRTLTVVPGGDPAPADSGGATPASAAPDAPADMGSPTGWWVSAALAVAWLLTLLLWWRDRRRSSEREAGSLAAVRETSRRGAEQRLKAACARNDPRAARDALLEWGRVLWAEHPPRGLGDLASRVDDSVAAQISALQQVLYAPAGGDWSGDALYRAVTAFDHAAVERDTGRAEVLKPLYGH